MNCSTCNVTTANSLFCYVCDAYLPKNEIGVKSALMRRVGALIADIVFYLLLFAGSALIFSAIHFDAGNKMQAVMLGIFTATVSYVLLSLWLLSRGRTAGKWLVGIRVVDKRNGDLPGLGRMLIRETIGKWVSGFFLSLGYFWAIWDRDAQAWHDKIANTVVLHQREKVDYPLRLQDKFMLAAPVVFIGLVIGGVLLAKAPRPAEASITPAAVKSTSPVVVSMIVGYKPVHSERFGYSGYYPQDFIQEEPSEDRMVFVSPDHLAKLTFASENNRGDRSLYDVYQEKMNDIQGRILEHTTGDHWFSISSVDDAGRLIYLKEFVGPGSTNSFMMTYPVTMQALYEKHIAVISREFRPGTLSINN